MVQQRNRLSAEDLFKLPDDEHRYELVEGELRRMAPAGGEHGDLAMEIGATLRNHVREHRLGRVFAAETGFILRTDPDTVRAPDVSFVRQPRLPVGGLPTGYFPFAPDLAVEIVSPSDSAEEIQAKVSEYESAGVHQVWVVYPRTRTVVVHEGSGAARTLGVDDILDGDDVVPGFRYPLADLFDRDGE